MKNIFLAALAVLAFTNGVQPIKLKPVSRIGLHVPEPSDLVITGNKFYIASDRGYFYQLDSSGRIVRRAPWHGMDFEAVAFNGKEMIVADERTRILRSVDTSSLAVTREHILEYNGGANQGIEGLAYNADTKTYVACIEKNPAMIAVLDTMLRVVEWRTCKQLSDISAATYHDHKLYLLSDEEHSVVEYDLAHDCVVNRWSLPINNPEGIAFDVRNNLWITSDDEQMLYKFNPLP